jgi:hypothetical protein
VWWEREGQRWYLPGSTAAQVRCQRRTAGLQQTIWPLVLQPIFGLKKQQLFAETTYYIGLMAINVDYRLLAF